MSNRIKVLFLVLLTSTVTVYLYRDTLSSLWAEQKSRYESTWPEEKKLAESVKLLQQRFSNIFFYEMTGWSIRNIYVADGELFVLVDFPPQRPGKGRTAPEYSQLIRYCPVNDFDTYWDESFTQPFTIYIANEGENRARAIARCTSSLDTQMRNHIIATGNMSGSEVVVIPKEGEEQQQLISAASSGTPSFNQAKEAMRRNKLKELQNYLNKRPELVDLYDESWQTLLFLADTPEEVRILIAYGANPNIKRRNGPTVLGWLIERGKSYRAIKELIEAGADVNQVEVAFSRTGEIAELLLKKGAQASGNSLFRAISDRKNLDLAEVLYDHGARFDKTTLVSSPLHYIAGSVKNNYSRNLEKELLLFGAAVRFGGSLDKRVNGLTPLEYVQRQPDWDGREEVITMLRASGAK